MLEIKENDFKMGIENAAIIENLANSINADLEKDNIAYVYAKGIWRAETYHKIVAQEYKKAKYYVAMDYIPNGYRNLIVSKFPIGESNGRLVTRVHL
jgi:hypothetical protein